MPCPYIQMNILAYQPNIKNIETAVDQRAHVRRMAQVLETRCRQEPDVGLIVLPELATVSYSAEAFANLEELAEPWEGGTFATMASLAERTGWAVCYGFPRVGNGRYYISQIVVTPSGKRLASYDKLHLAQFGASMEQNYFTRGNKLAVFKWSGLRFGIIICYDFRFSELIKRLVETYRVDAILHPVAFAKDETYVSWHHFVVTRALEHQIYFLSVNQAGPMWGHSILCPPWIDGETMPLIMGEGEETHFFELDRQNIQSAREIYPFREDRLTDYAILGTGDQGLAPTKGEDYGEY